jgi:hypothetical protein
MFSIADHSNPMKISMETADCDANTSGQIQLDNPTTDGLYPHQHFKA